MPKALKTCPKSNKLPNLVTLVNRLDPTLDPFHCYKSICRWNCPKHISTFGQRLWLSWQSGRFQQQMSVFRNPVIGQFYIDIYLLAAVSCIEGTNIKKGDRMWPIKTILTILRKHLCIQNLNWWVLTIEALSLYTNDKTKCDCCGYSSQLILLPSAPASYYVRYEIWIFAIELLLGMDRIVTCNT